MDKLFKVQCLNITFLIIFQPDITAPGVSIIAAYTESQGPTNQDFDTRRVQYNCVSGTSMSCPHVSGIVGLLKTLHPDWSPAAIKSAIMTSGKITKLPFSSFFRKLHYFFFTFMICSKNTGQCGRTNYERITHKSNTV